MYLIFCITSLPLLLESPQVHIKQPLGEFLKFPLQFVVLCANRWIVFWRAQSVFACRLQMGVPVFHARVSINWNTANRKAAILAPEDKKAAFNG